MPWNNMQEFVNDFTKGVQILSDALDPDADNSNTSIVIGTQYNASIFWRVPVKELTDQYNDYYHASGNAPYLVSARLSINSHEATVSNFSRLGKLYTGDWYGYSDAEKAICDGLLEDYDFNGKMTVVNENDAAILVSQSMYIPPYLDLNFLPNGYQANTLYYQFTRYNDSINKSNLGVVVNSIELAMNEDHPEQYGDIKVVGSNYTAFNTILSKPITPYKVPFVAVTDDATVINNYITSNGSDNNYHETTPDGYDVYYGDNYYIIKTNNEPVTYNKIYNTMTTTLPDVDPTIHIPTYNENKYGPEPPDITDDDYIDMGLGVETDGMAMYNMAVVTRDELIQLITDFEANADTGLSFIPHVLGLYKLGFESSQLLTTASDKIRLHKEPSKTAFNSVDNYNIVQNQEVLIDCGSITVDREELLTNTFLDFSPYTTYEMFIPGCGWITLPDTIVGRTISVSIVFDLTTCSCKGVVRSEGALLGGSGTTLATVNGIIGSSVPLSINETGLQRAAIMNGSTQAAMALGTTFMGVGIGNPYMGASGVAMAASALASNHIAGNSTYTSTKGGATDYSVFGDGWKAVLKITRPVLEIPDNYGHSVGFVVNRYAQLSEFSGFTVCVNPHVHISATSDEKEEIKRLLESGVILPDGE